MAGRLKSGLRAVVVGTVATHSHVPASESSICLCFKMSLLSLTQLGLVGYTTVLNDTGCTISHRNSVFTALSSMA